MKKRKIFVYSFVALIAVGIGLYITGVGGRLLMSGINAIAGPPGDFDPDNVIRPTPDYSLRLRTGLYKSKNGSICRS